MQRSNLLNLARIFRFVLNNYRLLHTLPLHIDYYLDESKTSQDTIDKKGKVCDKVLIFVFRTFFGTNVDQTVQASNFTQFS